MKKITTTTTISTADNRLPNGATVIELTQSANRLDGVVLAHTSADDVQPFVTWAFYNNDLTTTCNGHYFKDLMEAFDDYALRAEKI